MKKKLKPIKHIEVGSFEFDFYFKSDSAKCTYLEIKCGEVAIFRIDGRTHAYGYLFEAANQNMTEQLHGFAAIMYITATRLTKDQEFVNDVVAAINASDKRKMDEGAENAAAITEEQNAADQIAMEEVAAEANMSEAERQTRCKTFKELVKNVIEEKGNGD